MIPESESESVSEPKASDTCDGTGEIIVHPKLTLDQFLKIQGWVNSGGQAKFVIQSGQVHVNGKTDTRRRRQLVIGDKVVFLGRSAIVSKIE